VDNLGKLSIRPHLKKRNWKSKSTGDIVQGVGHSPRKHETLSLKSMTFVEITPD
jgi:hypothetical protein